jgi:peptide/nickel transport system substrate-binding protein
MMERSVRELVGSLLCLVITLAALPATAADARPGEAVVAWHVTLAPSWFDPSTAPPQITAFGMLYAIHDALLRPLPGHRVGNSLAETWTESADGRVYEFRLRRGLKFHNGDPVTADDVKFSVERYRGTGAAVFHERIQQVEVVDALRVRFRLREAWPDFLTFYGTSATAAGIVVPRKYLTEVGDDGFTKHPIGAGPYRFVRHAPGVEVVLEAYREHWRGVPHVRRLTMRSVPEGTTRVAMAKTGEVDLAVALEAEDADVARRDPHLRLVATRHASVSWIEFADQWDPRSPWHDRRLRLAVNHALDRKAMNDSACLGYCLPTGVIVPRVMDFALPVEPPAYDPSRARRLLADAGYPNGLDAGDFVPIPPFLQLSESVVNALNVVGIRVRLRPIERAAFNAAWREKKLRGLFLAVSGNAGNAATRVGEFVYSKGSHAYGGYPDIDEIFHQQARERDVRKREMLLHRIQRLTVDRAMFAPIMDLRALMAVGRRLVDPAIDRVPMAFFPAWEDMRLSDQ